LPGPGDEPVKTRGVETRIRIGQGPQGAPARGLSLHAEPQVRYGLIWLTG
jgi:hypothetical protein